MGFRQRDVKCLYRGDVVDSTYCREQSEPDRQQVCKLISCPEWEVGPWEECSVSCGQGSQERRVQCMHTEGKGPAPDRKCNNRTRPRTQREVGIPSSFFCFILTRRGLFSARDILVLPLQAPLPRIRHLLRRLLACNLTVLSDGSPVPGQKYVLCPLFQEKRNPKISLSQMKAHY